MASGLEASWLRTTAALYASADNRRGPIAVDDFLAMFDFDVGPAFFVAGSPDGEEFFAGLDAPLGSDQLVRRLDRKPLGVWIEHLNRQPRGHLLAKAIGRF